MKANVRELWGEEYRAWEISITADDVLGQFKVLKSAARLVRDLDPDSVHLSGISWNPQRDTYVLYVIASGA